MRLGVNVSPNRFALVVAAVILNLVGPAERSAAAQATASIVGRATDESGAVLPGVTVTATSPALQVPAVTTISDREGEYRLTPLPIGTYAVVYELGGFESLRREDLRVSVGFVARVDVVLKISAIAETLTVTGAGPVVDVVTTSVGTLLTKEALEHFIPGGQNGLTSLLGQAPGVRTTWDIGGSGANAQPVFRAFGQSAEPWTSVEGVATSAIGGGGTGASGAYFDYGTFEEARVSTVANGAEMPTRGVQMSVILKSGGNEFHGGASVSRFLPKLQADNIDDVLRAQGVRQGTPILKRYDSGVDAGGKIISNKLWWYGAARRRVDIQAADGAFKPDGSVAVRDQLGWFHTEKFSYQMTPANRFVAFHQYNHKWDVSNASQFVAWESRTNKPTLVSVGKIEWQGIRGNSLMTSLQLGYWQWYAYYYGTDRGPYVDRRPGDPVAASATDLFTRRTTGEWASAGTHQGERRIHSRGEVVAYRPDLFHGNHELKMGFDYLDNLWGSGQWGRESGNYQLVFNNGVPFQIRTWNIPNDPKAVSDYVGLYLRDSWTLTRRLSLNLGLRYAHDNGRVPASCSQDGVFVQRQCFDEIQFVIWNSVAPRVHTAFDLTGDGRTVLKGGWGRFDHMRQLANEVSVADPNLLTTTTYRWGDRNGNRAYDPGEVNLDVNGADFVSRSGGSNTVPNPNEREPKVDEWSLSLERELIPNLALRFTGIYSKTRDTYRRMNTLRPPEAYTVPVTRPDPGPDGRVGTADDPGSTITYYEFPIELAGARNERFMLTNDRSADPTYKSFEIATSRRLASGWQFMASYSATKRNVPFMNGLNPSEAAPTVYAASRDPNAEIFSADRNWEWTGKASGAYTLPADVMVSVNFEHRSGKPWARQVLFTGGRTIPSITLPVEPFGTRRLPNTNLVDLRLEKVFRLPAAQRLALRTNIYNVLNANTVLELVRVSGPSFLTPTAGVDGAATMQPRILEVSASYSF